MTRRSENHEAIWLCRYTHIEIKGDWDNYWQSMPVFKYSLLANVFTVIHTKPRSVCVCACLISVVDNRCDLVQNTAAYV